MDTVGL